MELLLDTNFILECIKNKIDLSDLEIYGNIFLPIQVYSELSRIIKDKRQKKRDREIANLSLQIIDKKNIKKVDLGINKADEGIIDYAKNNKVIVATMDKGLRRKLKGLCKILSIRNKKKIVLV